MHESRTSAVEDCGCLPGRVAVAALAETSELLSLPGRSSCGRFGPSGLSLELACDVGVDPFVVGWWDTTGDAVCASMDCRLPPRAPLMEPSKLTGGAGEDELNSDLRGLAFVGVDGALLLGPFGSSTDCLRAAEDDRRWKIWDMRRGGEGRPSGRVLVVVSVLLRRNDDAGDENA